MKSPFIPITTGLIIGIILYFHKLIPQEILIILFVLSLFFTVFSYKKKQKNIFFYSISIFFLCFGFINCLIIDPLNQNNHFTKHKLISTQKNKIAIEIQQELKPSQKYLRYIALIKEINQEKYTGKILFCLKKSNKKAPKIGNNLLVYNQIQEIPSTKNRFQFDYQKFMYYKDVFGQCYTQSEVVKMINYEKNIYSISNEIRIKIIQSFEKQNISKESLSIIKALFLGEKQDIDKEMYQSYSKSGAVHVLAISGLHIGIVLLFLLWILKPLKYIKNSNIISTIIILIILWGFAFVSGMSASVARAVTMYSFVAFALFLNRNSNIINSLWVSMFILLLISPKYLFDVGFQLSYLAVFSIVYIQPILKKYYEPKNKITKYFYDLLTVSVAAQLGVMPLSIYYFHQFPGLFFVTNILVIPIVTIILFLGFFSIFICFITDIPLLIIKILDTLVVLMNFI
ncbi:MAG: ComEC/Rec2 family competence protein, partial [Flavobacterium sp.]